jgi:hypothetical protein
MHEETIIQLGHCPHCKGELWAVDDGLPIDCGELYPSESAAKAAAPNAPTLDERQKDLIGD